MFILPKDFWILRQLMDNHKLEHKKTPKQLAIIMFMHRYVGPWTLINSTESPTHCWKHCINKTNNSAGIYPLVCCRQRKTTDININKKNVRQMNAAWHDRAAASQHRLDRKSRLWDAELIYGWQKASCLGDQKKKNSDQETIHESPTDKHELGLLKKEISTAEWHRMIRNTTNHYTGVT